MHGGTGPVDRSARRARPHPHPTARTAAWVLAAVAAVVALRLLLGDGGPIATGLAVLAALVAAACPIVLPRAVPWPVPWRRTRDERAAGPTGERG